MNDAIILLAISQIVCLAGMAYLYLQVQQMAGRRPARQHITSQRAQPIARSIEMDSGYEEPVRSRATPTPAMTNAYASASAAPAAAAPVATRMAELGVDVPTLARRMNKSEEEVKLMLRRQAVRQ